MTVTAASVREYMGPAAASIPDPLVEAAIAAADADQRARYRDGVYDDAGVLDPDRAPLVEQAQTRLAARWIAARSATLGLVDAGDLGQFRTPRDQILSEQERTLRAVRLG